MKEEIRVGVEFLRQFLSRYGNQLSLEIIDEFATILTKLLFERYINHWYANIPLKGQAFRCLRLKRSENYIDPVLEQILKELKLSLNQLGLPNDFTLWIDPGEVSVRFGDQVGFTYSIAKLDQTHIINSSQMSEEEISAEKQESKTEFFKKPTLIVQNAEEILFDEKLTAYIRQNSLTNEDLDKKESNKSEVSNFNSNSNIDESIKLSAEKRTIIPPCSSSPNNKSSSNIIIDYNKYFENLDSDINTKTKLQENTVSFARMNNKSQLHSTYDDNNQIKPNAFSFNDSCYYSSSSSSCASSFGSNNDESNFLYGWLYNENNKNDQNKKSNKSLFSFSNESNNNKGFYNQSHLLDTTNKTFRASNNNFVPLAKQRQYNFGFLNDSNFDSSNLDIFNNICHQNRNQNNNIYSDTSSERSDTPSSSITNASTVNSNFVNLVHLNNNLNLPISYDVNTNESATENSIPDSPSSSSDASTTTLSTCIDNIQNNNLNISSDKAEIESINKDEQIEHKIALKLKPDPDANSGQRSKLVSDAISSSPEVGSEIKHKQNNIIASKTEKEDTYCGYVESFPYYYKLNRLYNALAVQKLQADRLRKSNNNSPFDMIQQNMNNNSMNLISYSPKSNASILQTNSVHQWDLKSNNSNMNQNHFQMPLNNKLDSFSTSNSQFPQKQQNSILISTNYPQNQQLLDNFKNQQKKSHVKNLQQTTSGIQNINMYSISPKNNATTYHINNNQRQTLRNNNNNNNRYSTNKSKQQHTHKHQMLQSNMTHGIFQNQNLNNNLNYKNQNSIDQPTSK